MTDEQCDHNWTVSVDGEQECLKCGKRLTFAPGAGEARTCNDCDALNVGNASVFRIVCERHRIKTVAHITAPVRSEAALEDAVSWAREMAALPWAGPVGEGAREHLLCLVAAAPVRSEAGDREKVREAVIRLLYNPSWSARDDLCEVLGFDWLTLSKEPKHGVAERVADALLCAASRDGEREVTEAMVDAAFEFGVHGLPRDPNATDAENIEGNRAFCRGLLTAAFRAATPDGGTRE